MERHPLQDISNHSQLQIDTESLTDINTRLSKNTSIESLKAVLLSRCCGNDCCKRFTIDQIKECRLTYWSKKVERQRQFLYDSLRNSSNSKYFVFGRDLCEKGWRSLFGVGERRFWKIKKNVLKTGTAPYTTAPYSRRPSRQKGR